MQPRREHPLEARNAPSELFAPGSCPQRAGEGGEGAQAQRQGHLLAVAVLLGGARGKQQGSNSMWDFEMIQVRCSAQSCMTPRPTTLALAPRQSS